MKFIDKIYIYMNEKKLIEFIGFLLLFSFIWLRFISQRLPKDIPFALSLICLLLLLFICFIYIVNIYKMCKPSI